MPNLQVTYVEPQSVCFCGYRSDFDNRSDFEPGLCFSIGRSMNEDFLWWVG